MLHSCAHLTAAERSPALPCRSLAACIHCLHAYVHGPQPLPCFACPSSPFYRLPPRQCIPTTTLRSLPYAAWQGGADISLPASWAHPLLWRRGSLVAAPSGVPGWHNSHPLLPCFPLLPPPFSAPPFLSASPFTHSLGPSAHLHARPAILPRPSRSHCSACPGPPACPAPASTGKYLLVRDPNKPQLCLYAIPAEGLDHSQYQGEGGAAAADGEADEE